MITIKEIADSPEVESALAKLEGGDSKVCHLTPKERDALRELIVFLSLSAMVLAEQEFDDGMDEFIMDLHEQRMEDYGNLVGTGER